MAQPYRRWRRTARTRRSVAGSWRRSMLHTDAIVAAFPAICARPEKRQIDPLPRLQMGERDVGKVEAESDVTRRRVGNLHPVVDAVMDHGALGKTDAKTLPAAHRGNGAARGPYHGGGFGAPAAIAFPHRARTIARRTEREAHRE